ncbi:RNA repair pathway DNA polymerase beta [Listeria phage LIS04]|nr:RNA repair pathway DNA polymerase beta [Listeria phage LIS04]
MKLVKGGHYMSNNLISFSAVVGSKNYNLVTPTSDTDMVHVQYPTLDTIFNNSFNVKVNGDVTYQDIRKFTQLLIKGSPNYIEILFSCDANSYDSFYQELLEIRDDIAKINLSRTYDALLGMCYQQVKKVITQTKHELTDHATVGKSVASALRSSHLIRRFHETNFNSYDSALWLSGIERDDLMRYKLGEFTYDQLLSHLESVLKELKNYQQYYYVAANKTLQTHLKEITNRYVLESLNNQMGGQ